MTKSLKQLLYKTATHAIDNVVIKLELYKLGIYSLFFLYRYVQINIFFIIKQDTNIRYYRLQSQYPGSSVESLAQQRMDRNVPLCINYRHHLLIAVIMNSICETDFFADLSDRLPVLIVLFQGNRAQLQTNEAIRCRSRKRFIV